MMRVALIALLGAAVLCTSAAAGEPRYLLECRVQRVTDGEIVVIAGADDGIEVGDRGVVLPDGDDVVLEEGVEIARVEVIERSNTASRLRIVSLTGESQPVAGQLVLLYASRPPSRRRQDGGESQTPRASSLHLLECHVRSIEGDEIHVDAGQTHGLDAGDRGAVLPPAPRQGAVLADGMELAQVEVESTEDGSAVLRITSRRLGEDPPVGALVLMWASRSPDRAGVFPPAGEFAGSHVRTELGRGGSEADGAETAGPPAPPQPRYLIECRVQNVTPDGIYVDAGSDDGIVAGDPGRVLPETSSDILLREGDEIALVEVEKTTRSSALLRVLSTRGVEVPLPDHLVLIYASKPPIAVRRVEQMAQGRTPERPQGSQPFTPLLAPRIKAPTEPKAINICHGRIRFGQIFQFGGGGGLDSSRTRIGARGGVERIAGTRWSLGYSFDLQHRDGSAFSNARGSVRDRLDVKRMVMTRPNDDGGFFNVGRFLPRELPAVGYLDGAQVERVLSPWLRSGAMFGFKPRLENLEFSIRQPTLVPYVSAKGRPLEEVEYTGTLGMLSSLYKGSPDRLAFMLDQTARYGQFIGFFWTSTLDSDIGGAEKHHGMRMTQLNTHLTVPVTTSVLARGGISHFERPDNQAERDILVIEDDRLFNSGVWRYWVGSSQRLPKTIRLDQEVSYLAGRNAGDPVRWRLSGTRTGLPYFPRGSFTLTVYNLVGNFADGYGLRVSSFLPVGDRITVRPSMTFQSLDGSGSSAAKFTGSDLSVYADWRMNNKFTSSFGFSQVLGDSESTTLNFNLVYRW